MNRPAPQTVDIEDGYKLEGTAETPKEKGIAR